MPTSDLQITARVRAILASHWIDTEKLQFRAAAGTVRFSGVLARSGSFALCDVSASFLEVLADEVQRTPGVVKVYFTGVEIERQKRSPGTIEGDEVPSCEETATGESDAMEPVGLETQSELAG